jgi:hypothetical protein
LAKITPFWHGLADNVLIQHWNNANGKIASDPAADLKKAN